MWKLNLQLILTWYFLTCIPPGLIAPNLLNSCPTISTVASKGKFLIKTEYPGSADKASVTVQNKNNPISFICLKNTEKELTIRGFGFRHILLAWGCSVSRF